MIPFLKQKPLKPFIVRAGPSASANPAERDTHVAVPWNEVEVARGLEEITVPVNEDNVDDYSVFGEAALLAVVQPAASREAIVRVRGNFFEFKNPVF